MRKGIVFLLLFIVLLTACAIPTEQGGITPTSVPQNTEEVVAPTSTVEILVTEVPTETQVAEDCMESANTQLAMDECATQKAQNSQQMLTQLIEELQLKYADTDMGRNLVEIQKEWEALREKDCQWQSSFFEGGSIAPMRYAICVYGYNARRISELKFFLCEGAGMTGPCEESKKYDNPSQNVSEQP